MNPNAPGNRPPAIRMPSGPTQGAAGISARAQSAIAAVAHTAHTISARTPAPRPPAPAPRNAPPAAAASAASTQDGAPAAAPAPASAADGAAEEGVPVNITLNLPPEALEQALQDQRAEGELPEAVELLIVNVAPVVLLIGLKVLSDSLSLFTLYFFLQAAHIYCDVKIVLEVGREYRLGVSILQLVTVAILAFLTCTYVPSIIWSNYTDVLKPLVFLKSNELVGKEDDFWRVGLVCTIASLAAKQACLGVKAVIAALPKQPNTILCRKGKRQLYKLIELGCQLYIEVVPILPWWSFMRSGGETPLMHMLTIVYALLYLQYKLFKVATVRVPQFVEVVKEIQTGKYDTAYGTPTPASELKPNQTCNICTDVLNNPISLSCKHVFCLGCMTRWIEEEHKRECPMCRAVVYSGGEWHSAESKALVFAF